MREIRYIYTLFFNLSDIPPVFNPVYHLVCVKSNGCVKRFSR